MIDGLTYEQHFWKDSRCHVLTVDLTKLRIGAAPAFPYFPMSNGFPVRPPQLAREAGGVASVGAGFPITLNHPLGITGQPFQLLVIEDEIWTTGVGRGGSVFLTMNGACWVQPATTSVRFWFEGKAIKIDEINLGHKGTVLFTPRGGTNARPGPKRIHTILSKKGEGQLVDGKWTQEWTVMPQKSDFRAGGLMKARYRVIETDAPLPLEIGDVLKYQHDLGVPASDAVGGATLMVQGGVNTVDRGDIFGGASHGPDAWYIRKNPRTAIAAHVDPRLALLAVVEGRVSGSRGLRLKEFGNFLIEVGAHDAVNLDGGGSTHMWIRGEPNHGLVVDSCYGNGMISGLRPNIYATTVFPI